MDSVAEPGFADERLGGKIAALIAAVDDLASERQHPHIAADVLLIQRALERAHRRLGAARIDNLARIEAERLHRIDGHRSVKAHACHVLKISPEEASRQAKAARVLRDLPEIAAALRAGRIGLDHVQIIARVHANPRIKDEVAAQQERFLRWASEKSFDDFKLRAKLGDAATLSDLKRTDAQRRADAFMKMCNDAAGAPPGTTAPKIVHNIVWSADTYQAMLDLLGSDAAALDTHWSASLTDPNSQRAAWCNPDTYRCSTLDGVPLEPVEQFFSSLANHVRRVIVNTKGVVIDLGQKARLFTGSARHAAQLQSPHCIWPGCDHPTTRCEVDHLHDYKNGGPTNPANGAPLCGFHNRWKQKGFSVMRDPVTGRWRTYRPDGSVIE